MPSASYALPPLRFFLLFACFVYLTTAVDSAIYWNSLIRSQTTSLIFTGLDELSQDTDLSFRWLNTKFEFLFTVHYLR